MAVSQIALGAYFSLLAQYLSSDSSCVRERQLFQTDSHNISKSDLDNNKTIDASLSEIPSISWLPLPLLMMFTVAFNLGLGSLTWVVATEILPVRSRGYTHTIANVTSNFCWFLVTKTFRDIQFYFGMGAPFFMYGSVCVFGLVFIFIFLPETRGKSYDETALEFQGCGPLRHRVCCQPGSPWSCVNMQEGKNMDMWYKCSNKQSLSIIIFIEKHL